MKLAFVMQDMPHWHEDRDRGVYFESLYEALYGYSACFDPYALTILDGGAGTAGADRVSGADGPLRRRAHAGAENHRRRAAVLACGKTGHLGRSAARHCRRALCRRTGRLGAQPQGKARVLQRPSDVLPAGEFARRPLRLLGVSGWGEGAARSERSANGRCGWWMGFTLTVL